MGILCAPLVSVEVKSSLISVDEKRIIEMVGICHYVFIIYWCVGNGNNHVTMVNRMNVNVEVNGGGGNGNRNESERGIDESARSGTNECKTKKVKLMSFESIQQLDPGDLYAYISFVEHCF